MNCSSPKVYLCDSKSIPPTIEYLTLSHRVNTTLLLAVSVFKARKFPPKLLGP